MCYHFPEVNQNHRFHIFLQEFLIKFSPSVSTKDHAVAIQQSLNMCPHVRLWSCAETWKMNN